MTIAPGETGSFEVFLDGERIFSKRDLERFPEVNEVEETVERLLELEELKEAPK